MRATAGEAAPHPSEPAAGEVVLAEIDPHLVDPNPEQPRREFDVAALQALGDSIRTHGLLHPIVVERDGGRYRLVAGERRLRAVLLAGITGIAAIVRPAAESARQSLEDALTENLVRTDLSPIEEAAAYLRLADTFGLSHDAIALRLGRSRPAVSNTIRLLSLPAPVQRAVAAGTISAGHARAILGLPLPEAQEQLANRVAARGLTVRATEDLVRAATRGGEPTRRPRARRTGLSADDEALRRAVEEALGLPVDLERHARGGRVVVAFHDDGDLDGLVRRLGVRL